MNSLNWDKATPEQINLWKICNALIAWTTITPLYYQGPIAGSEFLTYNAGKLYIALEIMQSGTGGSLGNCYITLYDIANAVCTYLNNTYIYYNTVAANAPSGTFSTTHKNLYFSRIVISGDISQLKFNGYRLNV